MQKTGDKIARENTDYVKTAEKTPGKYRKMTMIRFKQRLKLLIFLFTQIS